MKTIVKEEEKEEKEEEEEGEEEDKDEERKTFWPSGGFLVWYFCNVFSTTGCVVCHVYT